MFQKIKLFITTTLRTSSPTAAQLFVEWLLHVIIYVGFVIMMQNIEEQCLRTITEDILEKSSASGSSILVNTNSDNDTNCCPPANEESTCKHHLFLRPDFPHHCLLTCVNSVQNYYISVISDLDSGSRGKTVENVRHLEHLHAPDCRTAGLTVIQHGQMYIMPLILLYIQVPKQ
jgi:hypothetical protein